MLCGKRLVLINAQVGIGERTKGTIANQGNLPWPAGTIPSDMSRFRDLTKKWYSNIYGRTTWDSIPKRFRPLDQRENIILTRDQNFKPEWEQKDDRTVVLVAHSLEEGVRRANSSTVCIAGGAQIYKEALPYVDEMHLTVVKHTFQGDLFFPEFDINQWRNIHFEHLEPGCQGAERDKVPTSYLVFERNMY